MEPNEIAQRLMYPGPDMAPAKRPVARRKGDPIPPTLSETLGSMIRYLKNEEVAFVLKTTERHRRSPMSLRRILRLFLSYHRTLVKEILWEIFMGEPDKKWLGLMAFGLSLYRTTQVKLFSFRLARSLRR
jgi:hypothetical protein